MSFIKSVQSLLKRVGNDKIIEIKVARSPLSKIMTFFLNLSSLGEFKKRLDETPYDQLYHLFMIVKTDSGTYILEKNEVIILKKFNGKITKQTEILESNIREGLTLNIMLEKTSKNMGDKFYSYKGLDNNCQYFINSVLKSNGLNTDELETFVIQDTRHLFDNNPKFRKIVNSITDVGAVATTTIDEIKNDIETSPGHNVSKLISNANLPKQPVGSFFDNLKSSATSFTNELFRPILKIGFQNPLYPSSSS
jgi:hypothetical protein